MVMRCLIEYTIITCVLPPLIASLSIAMGTSVPNGSTLQRGQSGTLARHWSSTGHLLDAQATDKV